MKTYCIKAGYEHRTENATREKHEGEYWTAARLQATRHNQAATYHEAVAIVRAHGLKSGLDVGCGIGYKLVTILEPTLEEVVGVDQPTVGDASRRLFPQSRTRFVGADLEEPDNTGLGKFDLIVCSDVIEHLLDPDILLQFIRAHCHANTYLVISTPERDVRRGPQNMRSPKPEHVREWNQQEFKQYLEMSGFRVERHFLAPAFRIGWSAKYLRERLRLLRKGIPYRYSQIAIARPA